MRQFRYFGDPELRISELSQTQRGRVFGTWVRSGDYRADVMLTARQALTARQFLIFRLHYVEEKPFRVCMQRFQNMTRGDFFHEAYRVEETFGRYVTGQTPYSLWPVRQYLDQSRNVASVTPAAEAV